MATARDVRIWLGSAQPRVGRFAGPLIGRGRILVETPFRQVAMHVVETPRIRLLAADLLIFEIAVVRGPRVILELGRIVAERVGGGGARAAGIFPFGLGRETVILAGLGAEPLAI